MEVSLLLLLATLVLAECYHTFIGTNVGYTLVYHHQALYSFKLFRKRLEHLYFVMPNIPWEPGKEIQGILAYDMTNSRATANVTDGGVGFNFMNLRMLSDRGIRLHYEVYIYA